MRSVLNMINRAASSEAVETGSTKFTAKNTRTHIAKLEGETRREFLLVHKSNSTSMTLVCLKSF